MSVADGERLVTKQDLADMYQGILPYLGGMPEMLANKFSKGDLYSTEEKMIGQWIDGKPLYIKTIQATVPTIKGTPTDVSIGASVDTIVDAKTMFATGDGGFIQTPVINGTLSGSVRLSGYNNSFAIASLQNKFRLEQLSETAVMGGSSCYVTVQYTKTTDSAVSIGEANEYSTDEKIVGTWIDGKPVYQRVVLISTASSITDGQQGEKVVSINNVNIENGWIVAGYIDNGSGQFMSIPSSLYGSTNSIYYICANLRNNLAPQPNTLQVLCNRSALANKNGYVIIQYTKTT